MKSKLNHIALITSAVFQRLYVNAAVHFDLYERHEHEAQRRWLEKRGTIDTLVTGDIDTLSFYVDLTVGTPPQPIQFAVNPGPWTWVPAPLSRNFCNNVYGNSSCTYSNISGYFNAGSSSSFNNLSRAFDAEYFDGSKAVGYYGTDVVRIGQKSITNVTMGVARNWTLAPSLGIGLNTGTDAPYPSITSQMVDEGLIYTNSYGIWLNDVRSSQGQIVFGGVDIAKYTGNLATFNSSDAETVIQTGLFLITPSGGNTSLAGASNTFTANATLQFGFASLYLPQDMFTAVISAMGAQLDLNFNFYYVTCNANFSAISALEFHFGSMIITMPVSQLLTKLARTNADGSQQCLVLLRSITSITTSDKFVLGVPFLRAAYVFFDYTNKQASLGPAVINATGINIVEVPETDNSLSVFNPRGDDAVQQPPTGTNETNSTTGGGGSSRNGNTGNNGNNNNNSGGSKHHSNTGAIVGGVVGGVVGAILIALAAFFFLRHRRNKKRAHEAALAASSAPPPSQPMSNAPGSAYPTASQMMGTPYASAAAGPYPPGQGPYPAQSPPQMGGGGYYPPQEGTDPTKQVYNVPGGTGGMVEADSTPAYSPGGHAPYSPPHSPVPQHETALVSPNSPHPPGGGLQAQTSQFVAELPASRM